MTWVKDSSSVSSVRSLSIVMEDRLEVDRDKLSESLRLWKPESELSPLLVLMAGKSEESLFAQEEVREMSSVKAGTVLELTDRDRLVVLGDLDSAGLRFLLFPDKCRILVQKW